MNFLNTDKKKIMVGINTLTSVDHSVYVNHCQMWYQLGRKLTDYDFALNAPRRTGIDKMRNQTADFALKLNCDYLLFIDDDVIVPPESLKQLIAADKDIVAGWTIIRGYPYDNMIFKWDEDKKGLTRWNDLDKREGLIEVGAVGFSYCLIKTDLLKKVPPPYFVTGPYNTEDIYFCIKAQKFVPDVQIFVDLDVKTAHCLGTEYIDPNNLEAYKKYYETTFAESIKADVAIEARGDDYVALIAKATEEIIEVPA